MPWLLADLGIALLAILALVLTALRLYRQVKALSRAASDAGRRVGDASDGLQAQQARLAASGRVG